MASKPKNSVTTEIPQEDIEAVVKAHEGIQVETNIKVEDRTEEPEENLEVEYEFTEEKLAKGIILTTYGEPKAA